MGVDDHHDEGTNKYYASGNRSALGEPVGSDRRGRPGDPLQANPTYDPNINEEGADKYYRNLGGAGAVAHPGPAETVAAANTTPLEPLTLSNEADLGGVLDLALDRAKAGHRKVVVQVTDADLERRLEAHLDMAQARQTIDQAQRKAITIGRPLATTDAVAEAEEPQGLTEEEVEAKLPAKEPTTSAAAEEDLALDIDPEAFVNGDIPEEVLDPVAPQPIEGGLEGTPKEGQTLAGASDTDDTDDYFGEEDTDDEEDLSEPPESN